MHPTSSSSHVSAHRTILRNEHGNVYATALQNTIERLIPPELMHTRRQRASAGLAPRRQTVAPGRFAGAANSTVDTDSMGATSGIRSGIRIGSSQRVSTTNGISAIAPARRSTSAPDDIDYLCAVASRDLIDQTVTDIRQPGVWNEHLLDVLLALKRQRPELLGAATVRVAASDLIPCSRRAVGIPAVSTPFVHANGAQNPRGRGESVPASVPATLSAYLANLQTDRPRSHFSFVHEGQLYHLVNTKEAFFRAIISVEQDLPPGAVTQQKIDALIEDTADFLQEHWQTCYRIVWTRMAKFQAT